MTTTDTKHAPRPALKDLRWHECTKGNPWHEGLGMRACHVDAKQIDSETMCCPNCGITFPCA